MRTIRVYVDAPLAVDRETPLPPSASEHLTRVLRLSNGADITCFNGDGHDYAGTLVVRGKSNVAVEVSTRTAVANESPLRITLVQAVARGEKMDLILQKATELGVARFVPIISERTEVKLDEDRAGKRLSHWRRVVESACEQSGRAVVPAVDVPLPIAHYAAAVAKDDSLRLTLDPFADRTIGASPQVASATLAIGPEGGFSERDLAILKQAGFAGVRLGPRILRTETAGLAAIASLQSRFGDFDD